MKNYSSFYVTLPSNSSMDFYPQNTLSEYITALNDSIDLEGAYEVALVEVTYPFNWVEIKDAAIVLKNIKINQFETIKFVFNIEQSIHELIDYMNNLIKSKGFPVEFSYSSQTYKLSVFIPNDFGIEFLNGAHKELGFAFRVAEGSPIKQQFDAAKQIPPHLNKLSALFVYTDIIEYQVVGDTFAPLLRTVSVPNNLRFGDYVTHNYNQPHYVPIARSNIDNIEINIKTDTGEAVKFIAGKVILKLHFRPISIFH